MILTIIAFFMSVIFGLFTLSILTDQIRMIRNNTSTVDNL
jgi:hypothetical protein